MQCSFAKQNTGHGTNAAKKVAEDMKDAKDAVSDAVKDIKD